MSGKKTTFALFFGNRGFFPASLIASAREEMTRALHGLGHEVLLLDESATRYGAVETAREGEVYANFLRQNRGKFGGVILSLPNFGDENGAMAAMQEAGVPILVQAFPDELERMSPELRRDSFCGKISIMDVFQQCGIKFSAFKPHTVSPASAAFRENVDAFDRVCRVVNGLPGSHVGAIGARTTPFKTVRVDEVTLQRHGITVEATDMADVIGRVREVSPEGRAYQAKAETLRNYTRWEGVPAASFDNLVRLGVVLDEIVDEFRLDAVAVRCWMELQKQLGISVCTLMGEMNSRGIAASCEVDVANALAMRALHLASGDPAACLDWNNNYGNDPDRCILFHCGPAPRELMAAQGHVTDHLILATSLGPGCAYGCNVGRFASFDFTFTSLQTDNGQVKMYLGEGCFTTDPIPDDFFGVAGVAHIPNLQDVLLHIGRYGFRHHVGLTPGRWQAPLREALEHYLGYTITQPQEGC